MGIFMITATETMFIRDLLEELASIAEASDLYKEEVAQAIEILEKLTKYDTQDVVTEIQHQKEIQQDER